MFRAMVIAGLFFAVLVGASSWICSSDPICLAEMQTADDTAQIQSPALPAEEIDPLTVVYGLGALIGLFIIYKVLTSEIAIPVITIVCGLAIVLFATYLYTYGDKNGDGTGDTQILKVVQPIGEAGIDSQYVEINQENTKTNFLSVVSITVYSALLLVAMVVVTGIGVVLHYYTRAKGG